MVLLIKEMNLISMEIDIHIDILIHNNIFKLLIINYKIICKKIIYNKKILFNSLNYLIIIIIILLKI